jgi:epoxyqueuosine reductase
MTDQLRETTDQVKTAARDEGFDACGIAEAGQIDSDDHLGEWLGRGFHADMDWMSRNRELRRDPRLKLPDARSVVVVAQSYYAPDPETRESGSGVVARYARGRDYHNVLRKPLIRLAKFIEGMQPNTRTYASIDTGPVMERAWAQRAGVASIGKNSLALRRDMGSYFFLATIITTLELEPDTPAEDLCGTCRLCIDACPTRAIVEPMVVNSNKCISYHTIENRGDIPGALQPDFGDWVFGCDICQEVCPWNRFARPTSEAALLPLPGRAYPDLSRLRDMGESAFGEQFAGSPIRRAKHRGMRRNAAIAARNLHGDRD